MKRVGYITDKDRRRITLLEAMGDYGNVQKAYNKARKCKRHRKDVLIFTKDKEENLDKVREDIINLAYEPSKYHYFKVYEPKERQIMALPFYDRVVQHAINNVLEPIFDKRFISQSYACRKGKGMHAASDTLKEWLYEWNKYHPDQPLYAIKADIHHYFQSIDHAVLKTEIRKVIKDAGVLALLDRIIDHNGNMPDGVGIPVGNLTSQLFANIYLDALDQFIKHELGVEAYIRYMDDFVILSPDKEQLRNWLARIEHFLREELKLEFNPKTTILAAKNGIDFVGYKHRATHRKVRKDSIKRIKRTIKKCESGKITKEQLQKSIQSWTGHAGHADSYNLRKKIETLAEAAIENGEVWQCVEDANIAWHCGASSYKHAECRNANSIGIEMCVRKKNTKSMGATDKDWYFEDATVEAAAELTRYLMNKYGVPASHVIRHYDVTGKICPNPYVYNTSAHTWDEFKRKISGQAETPQGGNEKTIWNFLTGKGLNAYAVAGIMGNLYAESGLMPNNLQNTYNNKLGKTDAEYTAAVDNGSYGNFVKDSAGYGLAQWTYWSRKQALLNHAKQAGVSIADLNMQLGFLWEELQGYTAVMDALKKAGSVRAASDAVLTGYEKPADQSETVKKKRAEYGEGYYKKYAAGNGTKYYRVRKSWTDAASQLGAFTSLENAKSACKAGYTVYDDNGKAVYTAAGQQTSAGVPFSVQVDILDLNIRTGAGTNYAKTGETTGKGVFTIVEVKAGQGASAGWGRLKSGAGWISLDYATRLA